MTDCDWQRRVSRSGDCSSARVDRQSPELCNLTIITCPLKPTTQMFQPANERLGLFQSQRLSGLQGAHLTERLQLTIHLSFAPTRVALNYFRMPQLCAFVRQLACDCRRTLDCMIAESFADCLLNPDQFI